MIVYGTRATKGRNCVSDTSSIAKARSGKTLLPKRLFSPFETPGKSASPLREAVPSSITRLRSASDRRQWGQIGLDEFLLCVRMHSSLG